MKLNAQTNTRHTIRPLSVFTFCGRPIVEARETYHLLTQDLPLCEACKRAHERAAQALTKGDRRRSLG